MLDLYGAIAVVGAASVALFFLGIRAALRAGRPVVAALALLACGVVVAFASVLRDSLAMTRVFPFSGAIVLANWLPPAVSFLAGLAWGRSGGGAGRKAVLVVPLIGLCVYQSYKFLWEGVPPLDGRWKDGVCRQTSADSCSAAAAATLLKAHGIDATEAEMARLCLTRAGGTPMLGLYRGLKLKTRGTAWEVRPFRGDVASLRAGRGPVLLSVRLDARPGVDPRYANSWGWAPGVAHTVVFYGFRPDGKVEVGDPSVGREHWRVRDLEVLWHGEGIQMETQESQGLTKP